MRRRRDSEKKPEHRFDGEVRRHVLNRDAECIIPKLVRRGLIPSSEVTPCRDVWGNPIYRWTPQVLEFNHVKPHAQMGGPRPFSSRWAVAACHQHNAVDHAVSKFVDAIRAHLARLEEVGLL